MEPIKQEENIIIKDNYRILAYLSNYLNLAPDLINQDEIDEIIKYGVTSEKAFGFILAAEFGLDLIDQRDDQDFFNHYFIQMIHKLDSIEYANNPYYKNIRIPNIKIGKSELKYEKYKAFEGFVCNDLVKTEEGRLIPQIGFFEREFKYPAILEEGRIWMTITPNEIETMKEAIAQAYGNVLTFGLGLGYYTYMISEKENVECITVVEVNEDIIKLFNQYILPQFKYGHKITIIQADAFEYARKHIAKGKFDFVFTDLWHDVSDGKDIYLKMKKFECQSPHTIFMYWIEQTILCYL